MEDALIGKDTMMSAIIGVPIEKVEELCKKYREEKRRVEIANLNCPGQIVVGGNREDVKEMMAGIKSEKMGKAIALKVSGAFHTSYMKSAGEVLRSEFQSISFREMNIPIVWNLTGREKREEESISQLLISQVQQPVKFQTSIEYMISKGVDTFVEIGFGKVLEGFVKKIDENSRVFSCNSRESLDEIVKNLKE